MKLGAYKHENGYGNDDGADDDGDYDGDGDSDDDDTLAVMTVTMMMVTLFHTGCHVHSDAPFYAVGPISSLRKSQLL